MAYKTMSDLYTGNREEWPVPQATRELCVCAIKNSEQPTVDEDQMLCRDDLCCEI